ncbi:DUF3305 domain-containing protein [Vibrio sp. 404]|uniref:DUF3305 domain-containing protein n=1 Tax=Vibrio marinisediminis TaxID=2758441 RepID=A0A7W2FSM6_9VIBR|nr:DUF3305 domain-containing protein [Vibrio marinisediminis]MBA5763502.1 DUF3305 domain-containing protein [Vibrio marinisediminis]
MSTLTLEKTEELWPIECELTANEISTGKWVTIQQQLTGFNLKPGQQSDKLTLLQLHKDERTDYRFNLSSQQPKLFLVLDTFDGDEQAKIVTLTASQNVASRFMDGEYLVLSDDMPLAVQAWMEAYIGRHGELLEMRRKKRKGAGRSNGN